MSDQQDSPSLEDLTPEEASRIIHSHRKVRYGTACWPCRQRKVKCDNKQPCENCVKRDHAQLCSYKPNRSASGKQSASLGSESGQGKKRPHSPDDSGSGRHASSDRSGEGPIKVDSDTNEVTRYLGQNSIPALLREQSSPNDRQEGVENIRQDMRSIFGLDTSAPFPLMSSRHIDRLTLDISHELPSDREVMKLFRTYKEIPQPFWGFVIDIDSLEARLMVYLEERAKNAKNSSKPTKPVSASWLAVLFSVLAVGSQYHDSPYHIRTRDSQKYIQISFHFLRLGNFLLRPNLDSIQALCMTGFVLLNDMKAEASWALLGLSSRLAQSLGLDRSQTFEGPESPDSKMKEMGRRRLWWTLTWHDALTSLSFDRMPMTFARSCPFPEAENPSEGWNYLEGMYHVCQFICQRLNPEVTATATYHQILENCQAVEAIREKMLPQLRNKEACKSAMDRLYHFAIRLHTSFVMSVCCRPALRRGDKSGFDASQKRILAQKCKDNLVETVKMFLAMHQLSVIPTRSWAFTYHGLSSAVLLGILGETQADSEVRRLQGDLISALSATAAKEQTPSPSNIIKTDKDIELSGPLSRALAALKNIYDHGSLQVKKEDSTGSGARTPLQLLPPPSSQSTDTQKVITPFRGQLLPGLDPHQDAALTMAEMQNGTGLPDFSSSAPYVPPIQGQGLQMTDLTAIDPSTHMSPMDLYDQIFWEVPDPWNTGMVDSMNFDFLAQPPPGQAQQQFYF